MKKKLAAILSFVLVAGGVFTGVKLCCKKNGKGKAGTKVIYADVKEVIGRYQGLADNNFFEVRISGGEEEDAFWAFKLTDIVRTKFDELILDQGDIVVVKFFEDENEQNVVIEIEKLEKSM